MTEQSTNNVIPPVSLETPAATPLPSIDPNANSIESWPLVITSVTTKESLTLVAHTGNRSRVTYPSIIPSKVVEGEKTKDGLPKLEPAYPSEDEQIKLVAMVESFMGSKDFNQFVIDSYDQYLYLTFVSTGVGKNRDKFVEILSNPSIERMPKKMSVVYMKQLQEHAKNKPDGKDVALLTAWTEKKKELLKLHQEAQEKELMELLGE